MSLKAFHLFFITLSIVLAAFTAAWATEQYRAAHDASYIAMAIGSALAGAGLAVYGTAFQRKARRFS